MQSYLTDSHVKVFVNPLEKPIGVIKTANIGICHDQLETTYH